MCIGVSSAVERPTVEMIGGVTLTWTGWSLEDVFGGYARFLSDVRRLEIDRPTPAIPRPISEIGPTDPQTPSPKFLSLDPFLLADSDTVPARPLTRDSARDLHRSPARRRALESTDAPLRSARLGPPGRRPAPGSSASCVLGCPPATCSNPRSTATAKYILHHTTSIHPRSAPATRARACTQRNMHRLYQHLLCTRSWASSNVC